MTAAQLAADALGPPGMWRIVRIIVFAFAVASLLRLIPYQPPEPGRPRRARRRVVAPAVVTVIALVAAGCGYGLTHHHHGMPVRVTTGHTGSPAVSASMAAGPASPLIGVFEAGATASYKPVSTFAAAAGARPGIALYYSGWGDPFQIRFATWAHQNGAIPFAQMEPKGVSLAAITTGRYDGYLRSFAAAVRGYGHQVVLGFAPEMNGNWYAWGDGHSSPAAWIAAWRHVVAAFRQAGAVNVTWLWTVSSLNASSAPLHQWWPGAAYVDWIGIDGYYFTSRDTFTSVFGATIREIRHFTAAPILISETATGPGPQQVTQISGLFAGVRADHLAGLVWFDMAQHDGLYHQDWRLEDTPAALAAFRGEVSSQGRS